MSAITSEELRVKADELGIKYTSKTSDDTLLAKIEKAEKEKKEVDSKVQAREAATNRRLKRRVKVVPLNPCELHLDAKYFMIFNRNSSEKVIVKFNTPWFLSAQMIDHLKGLRYLYVPSNIKKPSDRGISSKDELKREYKPAYQVVELGNISEEEFNEMKKEKALKNASIKEE